MQVFIKRALRTALFAGGLLVAGAGAAHAADDAPLVGQDVVPLSVTATVDEAPTEVVGSTSAQPIEDPATLVAVSSGENDAEVSLGTVDVAAPEASSGSDQTVTVDVLGDAGSPALIEPGTADLSAAAVDVDLVSAPDQSAVVIGSDGTPAGVSPTEATVVLGSAGAPAGTSPTDASVVVGTADEATTVVVTTDAAPMFARRTSLLVAGAPDVATDLGTGLTDLSVLGATADDAALVSASNQGTVVGASRLSGASLAAGTSAGVSVASASASTELPKALAFTGTGAGLVAFLALLLIVGGSRLRVSTEA